MAVTHPTGPEARRILWRTVPAHVRRGGYAWLAVVGAWAAPSLALAFLEPTSPSVTSGRVGPATIALIVLAVAATVAWGSVLRTHHLTRMVMPSIVLSSTVILGWCQALAVVWTRDGSDVNPEAIIFLFAAVFCVSVAAISVALAVGCGLRTRRN